MIKKFTAFAIAFIGSQIATSAIAGLPNQGATSANQLRLPGNNIMQVAQATCQVNGGADNRGGTDLRNSPNGANVGFLNNGTNVMVQGKTADGQWLSVVAPGNAQGWVWSNYLVGNCNTNNIIGGGGGNVTNPGTGRLCTVVPSPGFNSIDMRAQPRAESPLVQPLAAGTQVREVPAPPGLTSERKWMYVQSVQNPNQVGWAWRNYLQCQ
jgi:hypothetical protein